MTRALRIFAALAALAAPLAAFAAGDGPGQVPLLELPRGEVDAYDQGRLRGVRLPPPPRLAAGFS